MARKFKLPPSYFSKLYNSIRISQEDLGLPSQKDLISFKKRNSQENEIEEEKNKEEIDQIEKFLPPNPISEKAMSYPKVPSQLF